MATPGDTISIVETTALDNAGRFNTIRFTFTGDTLLSEVRMFDADDILLSVLTNVESGIEYSVVTGEGVVSSGFTFFPLPPAPVARIDFIPEGEDVVLSPSAVITNIQVGSRTTQTTGLGLLSVVFQEIKDARYFTGSPEYGNITGGTPAEWPRDPVTGMYYELGQGDPANTFDYISTAHLTIIEAIQSSGELIPIIGHNEQSERINLGMLNTDTFKKYSASVR